MDYYKILGVERTANETEIKKAYRRMAAKHHPDREGGSKEEFQKIEEAYRILSDPQKRQEYDNPNPFQNINSAGFNPFGGNPFEDLFAQFSRRQHQQKIYTVTIFVTLQKVARGDTEVIQIQTPAGSKEFNISIPKGIEDGQRINYENLMPDGVLQILFRIHKHNQFERHGLNLYHTVQLSVFDMILGVKVTVPTILDQTLEVNVPPNTKPGAALRIPGHGLEAKNGKGDQFVLISPVIPDKISDELLNALKNERNLK